MKNRINRFIKRILITIKRPEMAILPGQLAFFFVLSLVPIISLIGVVASFFSVSAEKVIAFANITFSPTVSEVITQILTARSYDSNIVLFLLFAFIIASNGMTSIIRTSNILYNTRVEDVLKLRIKAFVLTIIVVLLIIFILLVPAFGGYILDLLRETNAPSHYIDNAIIMYDMFKWPLSFVYIYINIKLIYTMAPDAEIRSKDVTYGALFTSIMWMISTSIFSYYVTHFATYDLFYGSLSNIITLMFWIYILCYVFVLGMALNASREELDKTLINIYS